MHTVQLEIKGKVQGVFFRADAKAKADDLGLTGWIRNKSNGDVEAIVSGSGEQIEKFVSWCKEGPERARVSDINVSVIEETHFDTFSIRR